MTSSAQVNSITDATVSWPSLQEIIAVLTLQAGYNSAIVIISATILGLAAGLVGTFALLRKRALMGDALAHSTLPGLAAAFLFATFFNLESKNIFVLLCGATLSGIFGVICVHLITKYSRLAEDTAIGAVLSCFFGAGIVLLSLIQSLGSGNEAGLSHFIYGQTAAMNRSDAILILSASLIIVALSVALIKEFRLISFDFEFAKAQGWNTSLIDFAMMGLVTFVIVIGLQAVGLLLVVALLIIPATCARFWTDRLSQMSFFSAVIGALSCYLGACFSSLLPRLPTGAVIVAVAGLIFFISFLFAPERGLLARSIQQAKLSFRINKDHFLRQIIEYYEANKIKIAADKNWLKLSKITITKSWSFPFIIFFVQILSFQKLLRWKFQNSAIHILLLQEGQVQANKRVRSHRLWEQYLLSQTALPISHVDFSADLVEHVLSPQIVDQLEKNLAIKYPGDSIISPHPLESKQ